MRFSSRHHRQENPERLPAFLKRRGERPKRSDPLPPLSPAELRAGCIGLVVMGLTFFLLGYFVLRMTHQTEDQLSTTIQGPRAKPVERVLNGLTMTQAPAGEYIIGPPINVKTKDPNALPERKAVRIEKPFWISQCEITKGQWEQVMGTRPWASRSNVHDDPNTPAVHVCYYDAAEFCERLSAATGRVWRLPTSLEWECAARAGTEIEYPVDENDDENIQMRLLTPWRVFRYKEFPWAPWVGMGDRNGWGLCDTMDNVREWCSLASADRAGGTAVLRGNGWRTIEVEPLWMAHEAPKETRGDDIGFRVVCEAPPPPDTDDTLFVFSPSPLEDDEPMELTHGRSLTYQHPADMNAHTNGINAVAVSPKGDRVVSICDDMKLKLWSLPDQRKLGQWHTGIPWHKLRLSSGARLVAMTDAFKSIAKLMGLSYDITMTDVWDLETGKSVWKFDEECVDLSFSPDGGRFAFLGLEALDIYDTGNWEHPLISITEFGERRHLWGSAKVGFSPDGKTVTILTAVSRDSYRVADGKPVGSVEVEPCNWSIQKAALLIGDPCLALAANGPNSRFVRFWEGRADEPAYGPPIAPQLEARRFTSDGRWYLEYNRRTGLHKMSVPFFAEVLCVPVPLDDFEPVPGRNEVVAASNRHLFLLSLDSPDEAWYFTDDGTTKQ